MLAFLIHKSAKTHQSINLFDIMTVL